jgi:hypothetical protein
MEVGSPFISVIIFPVSIYVYISFQNMTLMEMVVVMRMAVTLLTLLEVRVEAG